MSARAIVLIMSVSFVIGAILMIFSDTENEYKGFDAPLCDEKSEVQWMEIDLGFEGSEMQVQATCVYRDTIRVSGDSVLYDKATKALLEEVSWNERLTTLYAKGGTIQYFLYPDKDCGGEKFCNPATGWCYIFHYPCPL